MKKTIIISFDALDKKDFETIKNLPNFKELINDGAYCNNVQSVYPSITYPAHTTISTGKHPKNHGIDNNILVQPWTDNPDWYWQRKYINGKTIYDVAKEKKLRTAALLWPVTGKAKTLDINVPEIFANRWWRSQISVSLLNGSKRFQYKVNKLFGHLRNGTSQPELDNFTCETLMHILEGDMADFILVHFTDLDTQKHNFGTTSKEAHEALLRHDERLGRVINFLKEKNLYDTCNLITLGDHSFQDAKYVVKLNKIFINEGLIALNSKGIIKDWKVYCNYCDGSAYIYLRDKSLKDTVYNLLKDFSSKNNNCIKEIHEKEKASELGASNSCTFMVEASKDYYFINDIKGEIIEETEGNHHVGTHGYDPTLEDYQTFFICKSPLVKKNYKIEKMSLLNEGPTICKLIDGILPEADGEILEEIFI